MAIASLLENSQSVLVFGIWTLPVAKNSLRIAAAFLWLINIKKLGSENTNNQDGDNGINNNTGIPN